MNFKDKFDMRKFYINIIPSNEDDETNGCNNILSTIEEIFLNRSEFNILSLFI